MKSLHLISLPLTAVTAMVMLIGCGDTANLTAPVSSLDTTPPPAPVSLSASYDTYVRQALTWDPSAAPDVVGYQVYVYSPSPDRDNAYVLADDPDPSDNFFVFPIVAVDTEATYRVRAVDAAGNRSAFSAAATVMIAATGGGGGGGGDGDPGGGAGGG